MDAKLGRMLGKQDQTLQIARETKEEIVGLRSDTGSTSMTSSGISGGARLHQGGACPGRHPGLRHSLIPRQLPLTRGTPGDKRQRIRQKILFLRKRRLDGKGHHAACRGLRKVRGAGEPPHTDDLPEQFRKSWLPPVEHRNLIPRRGSPAGGRRRARPSEHPQRAPAAVRRIGSCSSMGDARLMAGPRRPGGPSCREAPVDRLADPDISEPLLRRHREGFAVAGGPDERRKLDL